MADVGDTFVETAGDVALTAHTPTGGPPVGTGWTEEVNQSATPADEKATVNATSDTVMFLDGDGVIAIYSIQPNPTATEYDVDLTLKAITGGGDRGYGVIARYTDANNYYYACAKGADAPPDGEYQLHKRVAGTHTNLGRFVVQAAVNDVLNFRVRDSGDTLELFINTISRLTNTDTDLTVAGRWGKGWGANNTEIDDSWEGDDFKGVEVAAAAVVIPSLAMAPYIPG